MILSDVDIERRLERGDIAIDPYEPDNIEPASIDLRLGADFKIGSVTNGGMNTVDLSDDTDITWTETTGDVMLNRDRFVLATTKESVSLGDQIVGKVLGRSSLGRLGVSVHQTAGYIDPGFRGQITLELSNHGPSPVKLHEGQRICQIVFTELSSAAKEPYGHESSQYQDQTGATPSGMQFD